IQGEFDDALRAFAQETTVRGRGFWVRTLHEFNGDWYPWGILYEYQGDRGNSRSQLRDAFAHVITLFREEGSPVKFQLDINANNGKADKRPFSAFWPGTDGLDAVSITSYNRAYSTPDHQYSESFAAGFADAYQQVSELTDLPIWVAETATSSSHTDKPAWILDAWESIALDFPRVVQVTWFLSNKVNEGYLTDWDLNTEADVRAFVDGFLLMRQLT
ncbi:glycoside hydrolase superfamily, partial [Tribonema minus]